MVTSPSRPVVTLDLWLTLVAELDGTQKSRKRHETRAQFAEDVLAGFGINVNPEELRAANKKVSEMVGSDHDLGVDLDFNDRVGQMLSLVDEELVDRLGTSGLQAVADALDRAFLDHPPSFLPGAKEVLERLRGMDLNVALISNTGLTSANAYRTWFEKEGVLSRFDELTFSNEIACAKPNPGIFCPTLEKVGSAPEDGLHIGDNLLTDISGAAGVGMSTGWIAGFDDREPVVPPDYTLNSISELPAVVDSWLEAWAAATGVANRE